MTGLSLTSTDYLDHDGHAYDDGDDGTILTMMIKMTNFFSSMVDPTTNRFYYLYQYRRRRQYQIGEDDNEGSEGEERRCFVRHHVPVRDLAAAWDATKAVRFFYKFHMNSPSIQEQQQKLLKSIHTTLSSYHVNSNGIGRYGDDGLTKMTTTFTCCIDSSDLPVGEKPNIGHSAMWILAAAGMWKIKYGIQQPQQQRTATTTLLLSLDVNLPATVQNLVDGILKQQKNNGAFQIKFDEDDSAGISGAARWNDDNSQRNDDQNDDITILEGIEFFPGEAMLALMEVYELSSSPPSPSTLSSSWTSPSTDKLVNEMTCQRILSTMAHAFTFYSTYYHDHRHDLGTNFNIWQIQCFSRFVAVLNSQKISNVSIDGSRKDNFDHHDDQRPCYLVDRVSNYIIELCHDVISSPAWRELNRGKSFYPNLNTLEIVCGLDALLDGVRVMVLLSSTRTEGEAFQDNSEINEVVNDKSQESQEEQEDWIRVYRLHVQNAVDFLEWAQGQSVLTVNNGGLGYGGVHVTEQRLDVTGHAISALSKLP